jgi:predicted permease
MTTFFNDVKFSLRMLMKNRGFTVTVILTVGLGVGANTAIYNVLDQVALRSLPVDNPDELVSVQYQCQGQSGTEGITNYPIYEAYRGQSDIMSDVIGFGYGDARLHTEMGVQTIKELGVTGNYFSVLGLQPALGRLFNAEQEPDTGTHPVVVISHQFWQQRFAGKKDVIGKQLLIEGQFVTIIGVTPKAFQGTVVGWAPDVYVSTGLQARMWKMELHNSTSTWVFVLARLKPGITRKQAEASLSALNIQLREKGLINTHKRILVVDGSRGWVAWEAKYLPRPLSLFMVVALFVLVIASVNIANIQLLRAADRQKEIAIRQALGAGRWLVIRQLLIESLLLALAGGFCGIVLALWLDRILGALIARIGQVTMAPGLNARVLFFGLGISLFTGLVFGLAPVFQILRRSVTLALKESSSCVNLPTGRWNPHYLFAVIQVAMAVTVLICTGLFVQSMLALNRIDPGYDTKKLLGVSVKYSWRLGDRPDLRQFYTSLYERVNHLPGVEASCLADLVPLSEAGSGHAVTHIDGIEIPEDEQFSWRYGAVGPDYFKVLNMPLLKGRLLTERDDVHAPKVMVINDVLAHKYWPNEDPLGKVITFRGDLNVTIVGLVRAIKMRSILEGQRPIAYWPLAQKPRTTPSLLIRTTGSPLPYIAIIRKEVAILGPQEVCQIRTVADRVADLFYPQWAITTILNLFGLVGLLLCVMGLYSVMAYGVKQRTRDIGIRMALGAQGHHVIKSVLFKGGMISLVGIGLGLGQSLVVIRLMEILLPGLQKWNQFMLHGIDLWAPSTFIVMPLLVICTALLACYIPARRAARIDPMEALRYE